MGGILIILKRKLPKGFICPFSGGIFHNIQTYFIGIDSRSQVSVLKYHWYSVFFIILLKRGGSYHVLLVLVESA